MNEKILEKMNTGIATALSAIYPGLGQFYNGKLVKGFIISIISAIFLLSTISFIIINLNSWYFIYYDFIFDQATIIALLYIFIWGYSIFDATMIQNYNAV